MSNRCHRRLSALRAVILMSALTLMGGLVQAAQVHVAWTAPTTNANGSPLTDLRGYRVYYGTSAGQYSTTLDAAMATQVVIAGLAPGQTYHITVTAYDAAQNESAYATEVVYTVPQLPGDTVPPTVGSSSVANGATNVDPTTTLTVTFSEAMDASTLNATTVQLRDPAGALIAASVTYNASTKTVSLDPASPLAANTAYTLTIIGAKDQAGNALANVSMRFTTAPAPPPTCPCSLWAPTDLPQVAAVADTRALELGLKFQATVAGKITGVRFYKGAGNTGTHQAKLWSRTGMLLKSVTFSGETSTGWQQMMFASPVPIQAHTTYVISYFAPQGHNATTENYFSTARTKGPLIGLAHGTDGPNGVYHVGSSAFPTDTWHQNSYWVDVIFMPN
jgi:Domain of unknown function (DUF4082)/Bacterial Ig-like domain/Fibronectin type III domain